MTSRMLAGAMALVVIAPAHADVTIKATGTGEGLGMSGTTTSTTYIKGEKMRVDGTVGKKETSTIFDVANQKMYVLDARKKEAEVWDMATLSQEISNSVTVDSVRTSMKPNGQTKPIAGHNADGYDLEIIVPATLGGAGGMPVTIVMTGTSWIVKGAPGSKDYSAFYQGAADKGWFFSDPRAAKGAPGQAKAMAQMYAEFAKLGGVPYESQMVIKIQGEGPMAALMSKMGGVTMNTVTDSVDAAALADDLFAPPGDYTLKTKQ
jgi:hypothetical protein